MKLWKIILKFFDQSLFVREEVLALFIEELDSKLSQKPYAAHDIPPNINNSDLKLKYLQDNMHYTRRQNVSPLSTAYTHTSKTPFKYRTFCSPSAPSFDDVCCGELSLST